MEQRPMFVTTEETQNLPILIVDKQGILGAALAQKLREQFLVVLVTGQALEVHENVIHIPYRKKIPVIPDNTYSHIFLIYNGEDALLDMLPSFVQKATSAKSRLLFITSFLHCTSAFTRRVSRHSYHDVQWLVYGELFDNHGLEANILNSFIHQARVYGRISIPNSGLGRHHPILLEDVLMAIIATAFVEERRSKIMLVFPKHAISEISLARMLQKTNPLLKVDFIKKKNRPSDFSLPEGEYFFPNYSVEERLREISMTKGSATPLPPKQMIVPIQPKKKNRFVLFLLVLFILFVLPVLCTLTFVGVGGWLLSSSVSQIEKQEISTAYSYAQGAELSFSAADVLSESLFFVGIVAPGYRQQLLTPIEIGKQLSAIETDMLSSFILLQDISTKKSTDPKNDFMRALATIKNSLLTLQKLQAEEKLPVELTKKIESMHELMTLFENTSDTYPRIFGFEGKRKYLVLFQNNMELRPGGGFIGSYALLEMQDGEVTRFKIYDVYDADGQMKTHVEPPFVLRRYLGAAHWYLRDSNFSLDFVDNAKAASRFLTQETGEKVDGVIAVDTSLLRSLIGAVGSITVPGYSEKVTADNFYLVTQTHAEKDFFPGSTQKKDFLSSLADALYLRLTEGEPVPVSALLLSITDAIAGKHALFAFPDAAIQEVFTVNNLSGSLWDGRRGDKQTFPDFLGVVDANIGANKANYYISRSIKQSVVIDDEGDMKTSVTATYENGSTKDSPFGGEYKDYVRFIIPSNASVDSVLINENEVKTIDAITDPAVFTKKSFVPPSDLEIEKTKESEKSVVGLLLLVPTETKKSVTITYTIPRAIAIDGSSFTYSLKVFKQPGAADDPYTFFLSYPSAFRPVKMDKAISDLGGKLSYFSTLSSDTELTAVFSKK